jgi:hypothetical protein
MRYWILINLQEMANDFLHEAWIDQVMVYGFVPHLSYMLQIL